ncbi:MAG: NAD(P)/FAD-dependent oxidoreductase [Actinomycetota bacterium]
MRPPAAPLAPGYREAPLWRVGVEPGPAPSRIAPLPPRGDVVVVGGGYCGLAAAAELARRHRDVVLVEAEELGFGASTRNGGMVIPELKHGPRRLERDHGQLGRELVAATLAAFELVEALVTELPVDCEYERSGGLLLAHHPAMTRSLRSAEREWSDDLGEPARYVSRDELVDEIGTDAYHGALLLERTGGLQPAKYHAGLVTAAVAAGARLHDHTRATRIDRGRAGFRIATTRGEVEAGDVLVATNAYADGLVPELVRRVLPVGSFIIATEVLEPALRKEINPRGRMLYDTRNFLAYWRLSSDGRLVFGGRTSLRATTVAAARDVLYRKMLRIHPQLAGVAVEYAWGGDVAITRDRLAHCGRLDDVAYVTGCNGTGIALATWLGSRMAAWMCGEGPPPPFAALSFPVVPLRRLAGAYLPTVGMWLRLRDRLGR